MKKSLSLLLALVLCLGLCACAESTPAKFDETESIGDTVGTSDDTEGKTTNEFGTEGLEYYPLADGTYGVSAGTALYLSEIIIPSMHNGAAVTEIVDSAFEKHTNLLSITIPDSITTIGSAAFRSCSNLSSITIPDSVTCIGVGAFNSCKSLTSVAIPNSVTSIDDFAFRFCTGLTSITIPDSVTSIGDYAFSECTGLTGITIPNSVTIIGSYAFSGCSNLTSITYMGTTEQWETITKASSSIDGNYTVFCSDGNVTK